MSQPIPTSLACMPPEILSDICAHVELADLAHLYATNNRILQRKLVSPRCIPRVHIQASYRSLLLEIRIFLRHHSGLEELTVCNPVTPFRPFLAGDPNAEPADDLIQTLNPTSLRILVLEQPVSLITGDKHHFKVFPLLERFPQLKHLEIHQHVVPEWERSPNASRWLNSVLKMLEGIESLTLKSPSIEFSTLELELPSTLTTLDVSDRFLLRPVRGDLVETMESVKNRCPNLRNVSLCIGGIPPGFFYPMDGASMSGALEKARLEGPATVLPFEDFSITVGQFCVSMRLIHMPRLKKLVFNMPFVSPSTLLLDCLKGDSLTSLSIGDKPEQFFPISQSKMTADIAKAFPASLTSLHLGCLIDFDVSSGASFNFFNYLPRCMKHLSIQSKMPSFDWTCLPAALESLKLKNPPKHFPPPYPEDSALKSINLCSGLPCTSLQLFETSLQLMTDSIFRLPSSLTRLSCSLSDNWEIDHVRQLAAHLPLARLLLNGNVRLTEGPVEGTLRVNLGEFAMECLGRDVKHRCSGFEWVADVGIPKEGESSSSTKKVILPPSTTSFTAHLSPKGDSYIGSMPEPIFFPMPEPIFLGTGGVRPVAVRAKLQGLGRASVPDLMQSFSTLHNLTSLSLESGNAFPLRDAVGCLPTLLHLDLGHSELADFSPDWLPRTLTSFTSLAGVQVAIREGKLAEFPPRLTLLVIPNISLLDHEGVSLPLTLKTVSICTRSSGWTDNLIQKTKSRLPNLIYFAVSHVLVCEASIPPMIEHLDSDVLRAGAKELISSSAPPPSLQIGQLELPTSLKSLNLGPVDDHLRAIGRSAQQPSFHTEIYWDEFSLSLSSFSQLGSLPITLTKMHIYLNSKPFSISDAPIPRTLLDLALGPIAPNEEDPFEGVPASVTRLSLGFSPRAVCRSSETSNIPPNLVYLRAMELVISPTAIKMIPKSLTDIGISGCGGWQDLNVKQLQDHIQPNAKIWLSEVEISGIFLPTHLESLNLEMLPQYNSLVLGENLTCLWTISSSLILPPQLTSLSCSSSKSLMLWDCPVYENSIHRGPNFYAPTQSQDFNLSSLVQLRLLGSLSLKLRRISESIYFPPSLTYLSLMLGALDDDRALLSALPPNLLHFHLDLARIASPIRKLVTELDCIPQHLQTLHVPILSPSEAGIRRMPISVTSLTVDECPMSLDVIKLLHPQISHFDASSVLEAYPKL